MAKKKRETEAEKAARERQEKIELLKMKQGLIEESEVIPESGYVKMTELHGWEKFKNFFYRNKAFIFIGTFLVVIIGVCVGQIIFRERDDLHVIIVASSEDSELGWRYNDFEKALEQYCPDFDGNGKIHVSVNYMNRSVAGEVLSEMEQINAQRLTAELTSAKAQLIIADEDFVEWMINDRGSEHFFLTQTDKCSEDMLYKNVGVRANETQLTETIHWEKCPDEVILLVREELNNGTGSVKRNAQNRERAQIVLQNILDGNIVNPPEETSE